MAGKRKRVSGSSSRVTKRPRRSVRKAKKPSYKVRSYKAGTKPTKWINNDTGTSKSYCLVKGSAKLSIYSKHVKWAENPQVKEILRYGTLATFDNTFPNPIYVNGIQAAGYLEPKFNKENIIELQRVIGSRAMGTGVAPLAGANVPDFRLQQQGMKIFLESVTQTFTLTNMTTGNIIVDIYDCVWKKDSNIATENAVIAYWDNGQRVDQAGNETVLTQVVRGYKRPFSEPYSSEQFKNYISVKKRSTVELSQGRNHRHIFTHRPNRMFKMSQLGSNEINYFRGLTSQTLFVIRGMPVLTGGIDNNIATLARCKIAWVENTKYRWRIAVQSPTFYDTEGNLEQAYGGSTAAFVVSEGAGDVLPLETAGTLA